ncbi:hypothetical protein GF322_04625 [Candidatus Dependentiae bacterium]|nr:hypothetical protein [Candidatus Dependentiae bacterium]
MKSRIFATFRITTILFFRFIAFVVFIFSKKRKPIALKNINLCFPARTIIEKQRNRDILKNSFLNLGHAAADFFLLRFYNKNNIDKYLKVTGFEHLQVALKKNKGLIFSTAHFGSCELAAHFLALKGLKSLILYNPIKKPIWFEKFVKNNREISGNILVAKQKALLPIYRALQNKKIVCFLTDQNCIPNDGRRVPLFGHNVWTHTAFINLSLKTKSPILTGFIFIKNLFEYEIKIFPPLCPEEYEKNDDPEKAMVLASNKVLECAINKSPEQWMWQHRRFKNINLPV